MFLAKGKKSGYSHIANYLADIQTKNPEFHSRISQHLDKHGYIDMGGDYKDWRIVKEGKSSPNGQDVLRILAPEDRADYYEDKKIRQEHHDKARHQKEMSKDPSPQEGEKTSLTPTKVSMGEKVLGKLKSIFKKAVMEKVEKSVSIGHTSTNKKVWRTNEGKDFDARHEGWTPKEHSEAGLLHLMAANRAHTGNNEDARDAHMSEALEHISRGDDRKVREKYHQTMNKFYPEK